MFALIETDCSSSIGKRNSRLPWSASVDVLTHYKRITKDRTIVVGYNTYVHFPMNRFNPSQTYLVVTIRPESRKTVHKNVFFISRPELEKMDTTDFVLVGGYTMFRLFNDQIQHLYRIHLSHTFHECDLVDPCVVQNCTNINVHAKQI